MSSLKIGWYYLVRLNLNKSHFLGNFSFFSIILSDSILNLFDNSCVPIYLLNSKIYLLYDFDCGSIYNI